MREEETSEASRLLDPQFLRMATVEQVTAIGQVLVNPDLDLTQRFRALFTLRNLGGVEAIEWISKAFTDESALLKHELAYCLGQMQDRRAIPVLTAVLKDTKQEPMVRHEAEWTVQFGRYLVHKEDGDGVVGNDLISLQLALLDQAVTSRENVLSVRPTPDSCLYWLLQHLMAAEEVMQSFESGVLEQRHMYNMEGSGPLRLELRSTDLQGEALGAIGDSVVVDLLKEYSQDPVIEVAETCQLAVCRLEWLLSGGEKQLEDGSIDKNPYCSVDPAPPAPRRSVQELRSVLLDESLPLFERYRAMFALRNLGTEEAVVALGDGLQCSSALFRHEIGYVLGQIQHPAAIPALREALEHSKENPMVRHEAAEALGSIGKQECLTLLQSYLRDQERVVKESCEVALDMLEYENSDKFQYADLLASLQG